MSTGSAHSNLVTIAARRVLRPLGMVQKGRSRIWLDDHGWWLGVVEFQPSGWARGSNLNVGCMWLWDVQEHISFEVGGRVESFAKFRDDAQFEALADPYAERAAEEMIRYRSRFSSLLRVCEYYLSRPVVGFWPTFHGAVACALAGKLEQADNFFSQISATQEDTRDWVLRAQSDAANLHALVRDSEHFRRVVCRRITQCRTLQKLPTASSIDFG